MGEWRDIRNASKQQLLKWLVCDLTCTVPLSIDELTIALYQILVQKWSSTIAVHLPEWDESLLQNDQKAEALTEYLVAPDLSCVPWLIIDEDEMRELLHNTTPTVSKYRASFGDAVRRVTRLRAKGPLEYPKHFVTPSSTSSDVQSLSAHNHAVGFLLPFMSVKVQERLLRFCLSDTFMNRYEDLLEQSISQFSEEGLVRFEAAWEQSFSVSHRRLSLRTFETIGYSGGNEAEWLIFDIDFDSGDFHCFPACASMDASWESNADNLQGVKKLFDEGASLEWLDTLSDFEPES